MFFELSTQVLHDNLLQFYDYCCLKYITRATVRTHRTSEFKEHWEEKVFVFQYIWLGKNVAWGTSFFKFTELTIRRDTWIDPADRPEHSCSSHPHGPRFTSPENKIVLSQNTVSLQFLAAFQSSDSCEAADWLTDCFYYCKLVRVLSGMWRPSMSQRKDSGKSTEHKTPTSVCEKQNPSRIWPILWQIL